MAHDKLITATTTSTQSRGTMNTKYLILIAAFILAACRSEAPPFTINPKVLMAHRDTFATTLAKQLESINYPATK